MSTSTRDRKTIAEIDTDTVYLQHAALGNKDNLAHLSTDCERYDGNPDKDERDTAVLHDDHGVCKRCTGDMWFQQDGQEGEDERASRAGNKRTKKWRGAALEDDQ